MKDLFAILRVTVMLFLIWGLTSCQYSRKLAVTAYYDYDQSMPVHGSMEPYAGTSENQRMYSIKFLSTHQQEVTGILSYPTQVSDQPSPVIILIHGLGDRKEVDYVQGGAELLRAAGYAVLRLDLYNHGKRQVSDFDFSFDGETRYRSREIITQSVFDIRRAIDFIESREDLDADRIGYFGISLGGIIGTIASGVDERIKVPVIVLAGGNINLMFGVNALSGKHKSYLSVMDPINFVDQISPRPLLMLNAKNDEVVPPITSKLLYKKARKPKQIIWYPAEHRTIPIDKAYGEGIKWYHEHL